jgi:uncharacterized protein
MPSYFSPGVYVEEVPGGVHSIGAVGTSTAAFVGVAPKTDAPVNEPIEIFNWTQFTNAFVQQGDTEHSTPLVRAVFGFFRNGGSHAFVVNVGQNGALTGTGGRKAGLDVLEAIEGISIVAAPGFYDIIAHEALLSFAERSRRCVAICDTAPEITNITALTKVPVITDSPKPAKPPEGGDDKPAGRAAVPDPAYRPRESEYGVVYWPWIKVVDPVIGGQPMSTPPSGHMAGVWARTDADPGVHKAPANAAILGAVGLEVAITRAEQDVLNPRGINCIRNFGSEGIRVWGARTLAAESSEWRYLNVRRLCISIEQAIENGTKWMVFEPNDYSLWRSIRRDVGAFLTRVWRDGALLGRTPQEAFFVQCDEETNPPDVRDAGMVVANIGLAVVKPAEFVVFKLSQWAGGGETQSI